VTGGPKAVAARVANVRPDVDGYWFHGCAFPEPLTGTQLRAMVTAGAEA
jgi:hypothetical protein